MSADHLYGWVFCAYIHNLQNIKKTPKTSYFHAAKMFKLSYAQHKKQEKKLLIYWSQ